MTYVLHSYLHENGDIVVHLVNSRQPFSTQVVMSSIHEKVNLPIHGILYTHTKYIIYNLNHSDIYNEKNKTNIKNKLYQFSTLLLSHDIQLDTNVQMHIIFKKDRCCC